MSIIKSTLILIIIAFISLNCIKTNNTNELYILSKQDSLFQIDSMPSPPPPPGLNFYSNIVLIFDSANRIYLYQVEILGKDRKPIGKGLGEFWCCDDELYPNLIDLKPNDLISLDANYLIDFIKDNDVYFRLDTNFNLNNRFLYLVSDFDTIKNKGFYELTKYIKMDKRKIGKNFYITRRTTEEEREVLKYKRTNKYYEPKEIEWSTNFLDGKTKPFTIRYDSLENKRETIIKAKAIFRENALRVAPIK